MNAACQPVGGLTQSARGFRLYRLVCSLATRSLSVAKRKKKKEKKSTTETKTEGGILSVGGRERCSMLSTLSATVRLKVIGNSSSLSRTFEI